MKENLRWKKKRKLNSEMRHLCFVVAFLGSSLPSVKKEGRSSAVVGLCANLQQLPQHRKLAARMQAHEVTAKQKKKCENKKKPGCVSEKSSAHIRTFKTILSFFFKKAQQAYLVCVHVRNLKFN